MTQSYAHQLEALKRSRGKEAFAFLMDMRTGKTKVVIDEAGALFLAGKIDALVVVAPMGVHLDWLEQIKEHGIPEVQRNVHAWRGMTTKREEREVAARLLPQHGLLVFTINWDALITKRGFALMERIIKSRQNVMLVADEVHRMKTPGAQRTRRMLKLGKMPQVAFRRILTGTLIANSPLDVWAPFMFLNPGFLGHPNFYGFRSTYAVMQDRMINGRRFKEVIGYRRQDQLKEKIAKHSYSITADECLDLPPRRYTQYPVALSPVQVRLYREMSEDMCSWQNGVEMSAPLALTQLLRLQQLLGGTFTPDNDEGIMPIDGPVPRDAALIDVLEEAEGQAIIWTRFRAERDRISELLKTTWGADSVATVRLKSTAEEAITRFRTQPDCRFLVANPDGTASEGRDFSMARVMVYYSNTFKLTSRLQSEARCDKKGRSGSVAVVDLVAKGTVDEQIVGALRQKQDVAKGFSGAELRSWLQRGGV